MTLEQEALEALRVIAEENPDTEAAHSEADAVLCKLLRALGYDKVVDAWHTIDKWYA